MGIRYPGGKKFQGPGSNLHKKSARENQGFANRGMTLEKDINDTNDYYLASGIAVIHKKPTPVQVVGVDYPKRSAAKITEAYFKQPSTTDYNGLYKSKYIDFEAKETRNKTSFPFGNIHPHQVTHMENVIFHGGIAFLIIRFSSLGETYFYEASHFIWWYKNQTKRKSIPKQSIEQHGMLLTEGYIPRVDYLKIIDKIINTM
ncbi:Holliday junction resolvase RecU [Alteribacillus sp. HJP-4]|uniref:Holliday junction resolvase RecU n=1 Tax=Alteribacillus sp. HJP-4 TaxID=2775394 RepID=UPI0035CCF22B